MKLFCLSIFFQIICITAFPQAKYQIDTVYYDRNGKGVALPHFASFYRIMQVSADSCYRNPYRDYYTTGELKTEGYYLYVDKNDDANSTFDGEWIKYYKSGKPEQKGFSINGKQEGEFTCFYENGLIKAHMFYANDKLHGIYTEFPEDNDGCIQLEYINGLPKYDYYTVSDRNGYSSKFRLSDNSPIWESPDFSEMQTGYKDGNKWLYYIKNGVEIAVTADIVRDYGKYYKLSIVIANNSATPLEFNPEEAIFAYLTDSSGDILPLEVYSADAYMKKVKRRQNWNSALYGLAEGVAAAGAGYSSSTTNTHTTSNGYINAHANAYAFGSNGYGQSSGSVHGTYRQNSYTTSTTRSYDGLAAYQAQVIASNRIVAYESSMLNERAVKEEGYLKHTTIYPGDVVSGYVHIQQKSGDIGIAIKINSASYIFQWGDKAEIAKCTEVDDQSGSEDAIEDFEIVGSSKLGMTPIRQDDKYGFIDKEMKIAIPCIYDQVWPFSKNGLAKVRTGETIFYINRKGEQVEDR